MAELAKTHILFPKPLLKKIDRIAGAGLRSRFVIEAAEEKLARLRFVSSLRAAAGSWTVKHHPLLVSQKGLNSHLKKIRALTARRLRKSLHA